MSYKKFKKSDILLNTMEATPKSSFFVYEGQVYYNNIPKQTGTRNSTGQVRNTSNGFLSLYEYNIDRPLVDTDRIVGEGPTVSYDAKVIDYTASGSAVDFLLDNARIYPYISKDSARSSFKTVGANSDYNEFQYGSILTASYPLSSSITREYITTPYASTSSYNSHYVALRNKLNFYAVRSRHYKVSNSSPLWNKDTQTLNLISIPSIFYGTKINPGSISLKWYFSGSLIGELQDQRQNGELIQVGPPGSTGSGSVAGVALYEEGFLLLTGSWNLSTTQIAMTSGSGGTLSNPSWLFYGAGSNDDVNQTTVGGATFVTASFSLDFKGHTETQVATMFAHAEVGEVNYSNNPTFIEKGQTQMEYTSSHIYEEVSDRKIKNTVSSSHSDYSASFERQVYISRVAVYDKYKNLIGVATLSNPILKKESDNLSFKLKIDI